MVFATSKANAATINLTVGAGGSIGTDYILGEIFTRDDLQGAGGVGQFEADAAGVNALLGVTPGTRSGDDPEYYRADNSGGSYPAATDAGAFDTGTASSITLDKVYQYLVVGYDGKNGGSQVYYIGNLAVGDVLNLVPTAYPNGVPDKNDPCGSATTPDCGHLTAGDYYAITHSTLLNPTNVPDGGMTISLLGMAMAGMGLVARRIRK
jgi:hypothetical protein